jgi:hypothetical protein
LDLIYHGVLRLILWLSGHVPWRYAGFLDHAANLLFLRKVGGGYIFVHPLLQVFFMELMPEEETGNPLWAHRS